MLHENGRTEELVPRISRFARDHQRAFEQPAMAVGRLGILAVSGFDPDRHAQQA